MQLNVLDDLAEAMILVCLWRLRDGLLDCVQVLYQFTLEAPQSADGHVYALINTFLQHAIERVERPGGSHEGVGRKKRPGGSHEGVGRKKIKELHLGLKVDYPSVDGPASVPWPPARGNQIPPLQNGNGSQVFTPNLV